MASKYTLWGKEVELHLPKETFPTDEELEKMESYMPGCQHGWIESNGAQLHYRKFLPSGKPKGIVVFMHGIMSHSGNSFVTKEGRKVNMALLADRFTKAGYALYGLDMLGHGFSEGYRQYIPEGQWSINRNDLDHFSRFCAREHPDETPLFLMGESYGACLCLHVADTWQHAESKPPKGFAGIILTGPAIIGDEPPAPVTFVLRYCLAPLYPKWTPFFMPHPVSADRIWSDKEVLDYYMDTRKAEMGISAAGQPFCLGTGVGLLLGTRSVVNDVIPNLTTPFCVCHGTDDFACPIAGTALLDKEAKTPLEDRALKRIQGAYHDLLAAPTADSTMDYFIEFMDKRVAKAGK